MTLGELGAAGDAGVVRGNPSAKRDLNRQGDDGEDSPSAEGGGFLIGMRFSVWGGGSGGDEGDEKQDGHSADEMRDDDGGMQFFGDGERAEHGLGGDEEGEGDDGCAIAFAVSEGDDEGGEDDQSQNGGGVSVDDFNPRLFGVQGGVGVSELGGLGVGDSDELSVACGPVGAAESRVRKARKRPQHNHDKNQRQSRNKNASGGHNPNSTTFTRVCS